MQLLYIKQSYFTRLFFCSAFFINKLQAQQNLVPNPSFEQFSKCPNNSTIQGVLISKPDLWYKPDFRGAQYYNICSNNQPQDGIPSNGFGGGGYAYQYPRTGVGHMALAYLNGNNYDYIQIKLSDSCKTNKKYYAEYYVNLTNNCNYACNNIGILFTNNMVYADTINKNILLANPQIIAYKNPIVTDTFGWVKISGIFTAKGGEQYLTLGNFKAPANTQKKIVQTSFSYAAGYFVDDVSVIPLDSFNLVADAGRDTTITVGDSVFIGSYTNGIDTLQWRNQNTSTVINTQAPGFWVKPLTHTCYVLTQTVNGYTSSDTVCVTVNPLPLTMVNYQLLMVNEKQVLNNWQTANEINVSHYQIQRSVDSRNFETISTVAAKNFASNEYSFVDDLNTKDQLPKTLYYRIVGVDKDGKQTYSQVKSINIQQIHNSISVYPNPTKGIINVLIPIEDKGNWKIEVQDVLGKTFSTTYTNALTKNLSLKVSEQKGLYFISFTNTQNKKRKIEKIVVN
jgi:hypothetical protein